MEEQTNSRRIACAEYRQFLSGGSQMRPYVCAEPSSFASVFVGKNGGWPELQDLIAFHSAYPSDAAPQIPLNLDSAIPSLKWDRTLLREDSDGTVYWEEKLLTPQGEKRRVVADSLGTITWLAEPAIRSEDDFSLIDYYAEQLRANASAVAQSIAHLPGMLKDQGFMPGVAIFTAFEVQWLIDYADMGLYYTDWPERYLASVEKMHEANLALLTELAGVGVEMFYTGSAGFELLSPRIFKEAIIPFQREFNDTARRLGCFSLYHICGHSREVMEQKIIDEIKPTIFETCSEPPCGNNTNLRESVQSVSEDIVTKGNLSLETLRDGTPDEITSAVNVIAESTRGRRHIIGQADCSILLGTPPENIQAFLDAANDAWH